MTALISASREPSHGTAVALAVPQERDAQNGQQPRRRYGKVEGNQEDAEDGGDDGGTGRGTGDDGMHRQLADGAGVGDAGAGAVGDGEQRW